MDDNKKLGRKGDPRMHRAVAARLSNPDLTLFEALRMGGFEYPTNDDASVMDAEKVTLGQRKNQLSRRLRLARKQSHKEYHHGDTAVLNGAETASIGSGGNSSSGGMNSLSGNARSGLSSRNTNASAGGLSSEAQKELQKLMLHSRHAKMSSAAGRTGGSSSAKRDVAALSGLDDDDIANETLEAMDTPEETPKHARIAKFHPDYAPLFVPPSSSARNAFAAVAASSASNPTYQQHPSQAQQRQVPTSGMPSLSMGVAAATLGTTGIGGGSFSGTPQLFSHHAGVFSAPGGARPSAVAVASLTATAQAVGLTLEQLAVALGSSPTNLAKVLNSINSGSPDSISKKLQLAMDLYQTESRSLYSRCLMLAGLPPSQCQESSPTHLQFALSAWKAEGKRVKTLLRSSSFPGAMALDEVPDIPTGAGASDKGSTDGDSMANSERGRVGAGSGKNADLNEEDEIKGATVDRGHNHNHVDDSEGAAENAKKQRNGKEEKRERRHLHRLEGRCGHRAVLHQPKDGPLHIDFVVDGRVECYHGIEALGASGDRAWPSKFSCEEVGGCSNACQEATPSSIPETITIEPKTISLSDINWDDPEWNMDLNGGSVDGNVARMLLSGEGSIE